MASDVPPRTKMTVEALKAASWEQHEPGLRTLRVSTPAGLVMTAFGIDPERFSFSIEQQSIPEGERVAAVGERTNADIVVNGGFFSIDDDGNLSPVGYLRISGNRLSRGWPDAGGFITLRNGVPGLVPVASGTPKGNFDVLQSKPLMIEPGRKWAMRTNRGNLKFRTLLCIMDNGEIVISTITRGGLSLFEAGWLMRSQKSGGFFDCDSAIALDGGRSTQMWVKERPDWFFSGFSPVQNFLVVRRRHM